MVRLPGGGAGGGTGRRGAAGAAARPLGGAAGVAIRDGAGRWLLHAGDAYLYHGEIERTPPSAHPAFAPVQQGAQTDAEAVRATRERLRALRRDHGDRVTVFSAHDPWEWARLTTPTPLPAPAHPGG
ncbi:hypothetical protein [Streptomyces sp. SM9]|uniref:hypothetical protein n=1 Tax=Streptomyces sp. SM9 TaxID=1736047 RepID=UPI00215611D0|nr:hypothetical protein [Streptomyces sp. SM9]